MTLSDTKLKLKGPLGMDINNDVSRLEQRIDNLQKNIVAIGRLQQALNQSIAEFRDIVLDFNNYQYKFHQKNPLNRFGNKCFSQADEDGITLEIVRRMGVEKGFFVEVGVGNGMENNTLILAASGWSGLWIGGEDLAVSIEGSHKLAYTKSWVTIENIVELITNGMLTGSASSIDVLSIDLDGNDIYLCEKMLNHGVRPQLFIVEYNAKFIPPARFKIAYNPSHRWAGDDYFGASLADFVDLFSRFDYRLICCNAFTGANAFFVVRERNYLFEDVPDRLNDLYVPPRYNLYHKYGHTPSRRVIESVLR
jgi:hypothetical protein